MRSYLVFLSYLSALKEDSIHIKFVWYRYYQNSEPACITHSLQVADICLGVQKYNFGQALQHAHLQPITSYFLAFTIQAIFLTYNSLFIGNLSIWAIFTSTGWTQTKLNTGMLNSARNPQSTTCSRGIHSGLELQTNPKHVGNTVKYYSLEYTKSICWNVSISLDPIRQGFI